MAKKATQKHVKRRDWMTADIEDFKAHSKARTPAVKIAKLTKRTVAIILAVDQYAEAATGNRDLFLNQPVSIGDRRAGAGR